MNTNGAAKSEELKANIVIVGGGGSGLAAAVAAAEQGVKKIIILEALNAPGGNSLFPEGLFGVESELQKNAGIKITKDECFKKSMEFTKWRTNAPLVRTLIDGSGETVDWLEKHGVVFEMMESMDFSLHEMIFPFKSGKGRIGNAVIQVLVKHCQDMGVQILTRTRGKQLLTDKDGRITGVIAEAKDGELRVSADGFIIATGGFAGNNEMISKYLPPFNEGDDVFVGGIPHKGDGIKMAEEVGAALEPVGAMEMAIDRFPQSAYLLLITKHPSVVSVNKNGERFANESNFGSINNVWRQPGKTAYALFDKKIKNTIYQQEVSPLERMIFGTSPWLKEKGELQNVWVRADEDLRLFAEKGMVNITNSWKEMAKWMSVSPDVLIGTIDEYNTGCSKGSDIFIKDKKFLVPLTDSPYYAIKCCLTLLVTHGVIKTNKRMEVMDIKDNPIPGLYVAGDDIGGTDENVYGALPGHSFGFTLTSGRIAGQNAARFITSQRFD